MKSSVTLLVVIAASAWLALPQAAAASDWGPDQWSSDENHCSANHFHVNDLVSFAESREQQLPSGSTNYINPEENGSIRVHGWDKANVLVRACIQSAAETESEARALASQVSIVHGTGDIEPSGPARDDRHYWGVSYEVWVPNASNLRLQAHNGSIGVEDVRGEIRFHTQNGSVSLRDVAGDVDGATTNGSLMIDLAETAWKGNGVRAETTNGSVRLNLPENLSARVEASTVNGRVKVDFPVTLSGEIGKTMSFQIGGGGPLIEARTVNGSIHIGRRA